MFMFVLDVLSYNHLNLEWSCSTTVKEGIFVSWNLAISEFLMLSNYMIPYKKIPAYYQNWITSMIRSVNLGD